MTQVVNIPIKRRATSAEKIAFFTRLDHIFQEQEEYKQDPLHTLPPYLPLQRIQLVFLQYEDLKKHFFSYTKRLGKTNSLGYRLYRMYTALGHEAIYGTL